MDLFGHSLELTRLVFLTGAVLAMLYKRSSGVTPGGIIVPAFLALALDISFIWFCLLVLIGVITRLIYQRFFEVYALPRTKVVLINIAISTVLVMLSQIAMASRLPTLEIIEFGFVIPGLIAGNAVAYGLSRVLYGTLIVTALTYSIGYLYFVTIPFNLATKLSVQLSEFTPFTLEGKYFMLVASLALAAFVVYTTKVRVGGYLIAPVLLALMVNSFVQFATYALATFFCYLFVKAILKRSLIIGLERFLLCLLVSALAVTTIDIMTVTLSLESFQISPIVFMVAMAVIVNDLCLGNSRRFYNYLKGKYNEIQHGLNRVAEAI
jgi:hypothetical protein